MMTMENPLSVALVIFTFVDAYVNSSYVDYDRVVVCVQEQCSHMDCERVVALTFFRR